MSIPRTQSGISIILKPNDRLHVNDLSRHECEPIQVMNSGKMLVSSKGRIVSLSAREIARTSRWLAWLIVSTIGILGLGGGGVWAATGSGNVFLQGDFVEVGIHPSGSFGTSVSPPAGFHARGGDGQLGFVADVGKDGWSIGTPNYIGDYFVPGSPEEGWGVEWTSPGGGERTLGNFGLMGTVQIPATSLTETSSGNNRSAVWMGTATIGTESLQVTQTVHYSVNDLFFVISVTLVNTGTTTLNSVEYMRNVDPDQEQPLAGGSFTTSNYVVNDNTTGQRLVVGKGTTYDSILGLGTIDSRAVVSTEGFSNRDPDAILESPVTPSSASPIVNDQAIALAYRFGSLAPGQSVSFDYAYILKESDLAVALGNLAAVTILQPTGTVSGNSVIFQATTDSVETTTQMEFFINGTSIGIDTTPDAGGVFERTFDSTGYANGTLNLKVVATFASGSTVEKSATVTVGNSGPPISFATPLAGSAFGGSGIPVSINVLDVNHPPVTVNFFRETASTGSVSLGQDSSAPFGTTFSVTDLPAGEGVIIKAVAADNLNRLTTIQVAGVVATREIAVSGNGVDITTGDTTPSLADHTDFGSTLAVSGSLARTFTITNSGEATLNLTGTPIVALSGPGASAFSVTTQPDVPTLAAGGGTRTFQITFHPATVATFVATVSIANDDADENPFTFGITGTGLNSAPTDINLTPGSIAENSGANATVGTLSTIDSNAEDSFTYSLVDGVGSSDNAGFTITGSTLIIKASPDYETKNGYAIRLRSTDQDGLFFEKQFTVTVTNVNEQLTVTSNTSAITINEGSLAGNTGTFNDPDGNSTVVLTASVGSISQNNATGTWSWSYTPSDGPDDSQTVNITANDGMNTPVTTTFALTVNNVAPTALAQSVTTNEDTAKLITLAAIDPGLDTQVFSIVTGPTPAQGTLSTITGNQVTFTPALNFNGSASFTFKATDSDSADSNTATVSITVDAVNDQPVIARTNATITINEGSLAANTGTFSDVDDNATVTASVGTITQDNAAGTWSWSFTPSDGPDNTQTVTITATDGGLPALVSTTTFALTVNNVAPTIALTGSNSALVGAAYTLNLSAITDSGSDTVSAYSIIWGDGTTDNFSGSPASTSKPHIYATGGSKTITVSLTDEDGTFASAGTKTITVNAIPTVTSDSATVILNEGSTALNSGTYNDVDGGTVTITASIGTVTQSGASSWTHQQTFSQSGTPIELCLDSQENLYVVNESQNKIYKYDSSGSPVTDWTVSGNPTGIAVDSASGVLYVSLKGGNRVDKFTLGGTFLSTWGTAGSGNGQFSSPHCIAVDSTGDVYVSDSGNSRIQVFSASGTFLRKWGTAGSGNGQFNFNQGIRISTGGSVYVADRNNHRIQYFDTNGNYLGKWGSAGNSNGQFSSPAGVGIDPGGNIIVGDIGNNRIQKFTEVGTFVDKLGPSTTVNNLSLPHGTAFPPSGRSVYIADFGNGRVVKFATPGGWSWSYPTTDGTNDSRTVTITATDNGTPIGSSTTTFTLAVSNVAPTISLSGSNTVEQGETYTLSLGAITDPGSDNVTAFSIDWGDGTTGNYSGNPASTIKTHTYLSLGNKTISVALTDEDGTFSNAGTKALSVVNSPPTIAATNASITVNEGSSATNSGTFSDAQGSATVTLTASVGSISQDNSASTWSWSYTPADGPDDSQIVTITANDGLNTPVTTTFALTVNNVAPTALDQTLSTNEDTAKLITLGATDPGADTQTFSIVTGPTPAQGTLSTITGNQVTFTPALNFNGSASFTFKATDSDGSQSNTATVSISVDSINDQPVIARTNAAITINEGSLATNTGTFGDPEGNATATVTASIGTLTQDNTSGTWSWSYTPADGPHDTQTVTITATDNGSPALISTITFALTVNNVAPTALAQSITTNEDTAKLITLAASDPGADTQIFSIVSGPTTAQGTLSAISGNQVTFTPALNFDGSASFTFKATDSDGADSNTAAVSIAVDAVNDTPVIMRDNATVVVIEGSQATNTGTFSDPEGRPSVVITTSIGSILQDNVAGTWSWSYTPADGPDASQTVTITATDNGNPALISTTTFALTVSNIAPTALAQSITTNEDTAKLITLGATDPGMDTQTFSIVTGPTVSQGTLSAISANQVTFTPAPDFNGSASFTIKATDSDGADSNIATVSLTVDAVNDQPVVARTNATITVNEGSLAANTGTFSDADGNATALVTASIGTIAQNNATSTWSWSYTPADGPDASQSVTITATDNGSSALVSTTTFALNVNNVAPTALAETITTTEDTAKLITLAASDPGADTQSYSIVTGPTTEQGTLSIVTGDQVTFTPTLNFNGNASFTFKATDSDGAESSPATVTIVVDSVNDQPIVARVDATVAVNEGSLATNTGTFSDADGNATATLTASIGTLTQNNTAGAWSWSYTPTDGPDDSQTVTITATDSGSPALVSTTTFTLTVNNVAPTALAQSITTEEDTSKLITLDVIDPGSDTQTFSIVTGPTVVQGTLSTINGNQVTFTPALNFYGDASFTFKATDSDTADSNIATVSITVEPINDPPVVATDMPMVTADEGSLASTSGTFADTEGNATVTLTASVGSISQSNADGTWSWSHTPADGLDDSQMVTITATDSGDPALVSTTTFALTVNNVAPTAYAQSVMTAEDTAKSITLGAADPGQDTLTFSIATGPTEAQGSLSVVNGNQVTFTPALNFNGDASFTFKATDSDGAPSNTALVSIAVSASNDAPSFVPGSSLSIPSGSALQQVSWATDITAGADDESEQALSFVVTNDNNTIFSVQPSIDAEGVLTYQPAFAAGVIAKVTVTLKETAEGGLSSPPQTFTISMTGDRGTGAFETMATFANTAAGPKGPIVRDAYGSLWGTTAMGGLANQGTIWKLNATGDFHTVAELGNAATFNAKKGGGLVRGFDGNFYITATGDATGLGSVLRMSPDGALRSVQTSTGSHTAAAAVLGSDGFLYGGNKTSLIKLAPTGGIVWSVKLPANTVLRYPLLEWLDGNFYGTSVLGGTSNLGVVFKVSRTGQYTVVKNLTAALGSKPSGSLITGHDGAMYGVTSTGGANGTGTVFRITSTGNHRIVSSFPAGAGSPGNIVFAGDGCYYGTRLSGTYGAIYKMTTSGVLSTLVSFTGSVGIAPGAVTADTVESLTYGQDGMLYGATGLGGLTNGGVLYSLTTTGTYSVLRHMAAAIHNPQGALAEDSTGNHFGVNATGGTGKGSIFAVAPNGGITDIYTFNGTDGSAPQSGLTLASDGNYYGTTSTGGTAGFGTLYRMTPDGVVTTLFSFTGTTGSYRGSTPLGPLATGPADSLYGTTSKGGSSNLGTVFRLTNLTGVPAYTVLANFIGKNGSTPVGGVAVDSDGKLFGTTRAGGTASRGCIYKVVGPDTGTPTLTVVASFTGTTGLVPGNNSQSTLIRGVDGKFYGTTRQGGASDAGTLFRISSSGVFELLTSFTNTSGTAIGKQPEGIAQGPDGRIYGTTALGGAAGFGVLFALDPTTKAYAVRKQFEGGFLGTQGRGLPFLGRDGNLYGLTATTVWRMTFAQQPTAKARLASATTSTSATLNGTVNTNGQNVTVQFEFGPTTDYGTTVSAVPASATGTAEIPVSLAVTGLLPHTVYHYRLLVTTGANTIASAEQTLTTLNTAPGAFSDAIVTNAAFNIVADELPDQDGDALDIYSVAMPAAGTLARLSATNVQYTPTTTLTTQGYDQFIYHVGDGMDMSSPALLTVRYQPPTGLPPALPADAVVLPTNAEAYATWAISALPKTVVGDDRLPSGDADRDRISNAHECLMGTKPIVSNASTFVIDTSGNPAFSKVRYTRQKGLVDGFETLEESPDGISWRAVDRTRLLMKRTNGTTTDTVETTIVPVPGTSALPYFRLSFSL